MRTSKQLSCAKRAAPLLIAAAAAVWPMTGLAATDSYTGASGSSWATAGNWSSGVPTTGTTASIIGSTTLFTVLFNDTTYTTATVLASLSLDSTSASTAVELKMTTGDSLYAATENVGVNDVATLNQTSGTNGVSGSLILGAATGGNGTYSLSSTGVLSVAGSEYIGDSGSGSNGIGSFIQTGGTNSITTNNLVLGFNTTDTGTYSLSGTAMLSDSGAEFVGDGGTGTFNQSGGTNTSVGLVIGDSSPSTYNLQGGTLAITSGDGELVGNAGGTGTFNQTAGTNTLTGGASLSIANGSGGGLYSLSGTGLLSVSGIEAVGDGGTGTFNQSGGTNTITGGEFVVGWLSAGIYSLSGTGSLSVSGDEFVGLGGTGTFNQSGGTNTITGNLDIAASADLTGICSLSGTGIVNVNGSAYVGGYSASAGGTGSLVISGGTMSVTSTLQVYNTPGSSVSLSGGILNVGSLVLNGGLSELNWTGGTLVLTGENITIDSTAAANFGDSAGTANSFVLGAGQTLDVDGVENVGFNGTGNFNQTGGTNTVGNSDDLVLGQNSGSTGTYTLGGTGSLSVTGSERVGYNGTGDFIQTGGTNTVTNNVNLGYNSGATGSYTLTGGLLSVGGNINVGGQNGGAGGTGTLTVSNMGQLTVTGTLTAHNTPGSSISLSGGTLNVGALVLGGGPAEMNWTGGTLDYLNGYTINSGFALGQNLTLSTGMTLSTGAAAANDGSINLTGGALGGTGTLTNNADGTISGDGAITVALSNSGQIVPTGGTLTLPAFTNNGVIQLASATANLSGGAIANAGILQGFGKVSAAVTNTGTIEPTGGTMLLLSPLTNSPGGLISIASGNELYAQDLTANAGVISLTGGTLDTGDASFTNTGQITGYGVIRTGGLTNAGAVTLTGGTSTVNGPVTNNTGQTINISYQPAVFTGKVTNNGTINATNTTITFTGGYSGNAYISDPSTNIFQNNVTIAPGGSMTGNTGDQYFFSGGTFTNQGTFSNGGLLQSSDATVNNGTLTVFNTSANYLNGKITGTGTLAVGNGSTPGYLQLTAGDFSDAQSAVTITTGSTLDITNNSVIINFTGSDPRSVYQALVNNGDDGGAWTGTTSITSSAVAAYDTLHPFTYMVALADGGDGSGNTTLGSNQLEITAALAGDCNLDGKVDSTDLGIVLGDFGKTGQDWDEGSFNGSGTVDSTNLGLLLANWQQSSSLSISDLDAIQSVTGDSVVANADGIGYQLVSVPEPATLGLLAMSGAGILGPRRRRFGVK